MDLSLAFRRLFNECFNSEAPLGSVMHHHYFFTLALSSSTFAFAPLLSRSAQIFFPSSIIPYHRFLNAVFGSFAICYNRDSEIFRLPPISHDTVVPATFVKSLVTFRVDITTPLPWIDLGCFWFVPWGMLQLGR